MNVQIQTTSFCNGSCVFCPYPESWHRDNPGSMSSRVFERIIEQVSSCEIEKICPYLENEPFCDKNIFEHIKKIIHSLSFQRMELATNAFLLTAEKADRMARLLQGVEHEIWISFHGVDARTHNLAMGLDYQQCLDNIIYLLKLSQSYPLNIKLRGAGAGMGNVVDTAHRFEPQEYFSFWERQFEKHNIQRRPDIDYFRYHDRAGSIHRNEINLNRVVRPDLRGFYCPRIDQWLHFLYNGDLILCCNDYRREQVIGNIMEDDLIDILEGSTYQMIKRQVTGAIASAPDFICKRCINPGG